MKHIIITPVYNESKNLDVFIKSVVSQTLRPNQFCLVDDNSTDTSAAIIKFYSSKYTWIKYVFHESGEYKSQGSKIVNAFNFGLKQLDLLNASFISKIDADIELPEDYFEKISKLFTDHPRVGIAGGRIVEMVNGIWKSTLQADYHIRGALKSYRIECFEDIGGLKPVLGWDGLDIMTALSKNWETKVLAIEVKHFRIASSDYNILDLNFRLGLVNYQNGASLFLTIVRSIAKVIRYKNLKVGISFLKGYIKAKRENYPLNVDKDLKKFINNFHFKRIFSLATFLNKKNYSN